MTVSLDNALAERFRSLVQRSSDLTLVRNREGALSYASVASADILGIEDALLTGRRVTDLVHPEDRDTFAAWVGGAGTAGQMLQCRVLNADGAPRWVEIRCTDLTSDPAVTGTVLHLRDGTERQRLENDPRHAQKMESVGQLAAGVAHEIDGTARVAAIVRAMKAFAHLGGEGNAPTDLNEAIATPSSWPPASSRSRGSDLRGGGGFVVTGAGHRRHPTPDKATNRRNDKIPGSPRGRSTGESGM